MLHKSINKGLLQVFMLIISVCFVQQPYAAKAGEEEDNNKLCDINFALLSAHPLIDAQQWIEEGKHLTMSLATIWEGHPAVRATMLHQINNKHIIFNTSPAFNMVKHFTKNPLVAVSITMRDQAGCIRQIRAEGTVQKASEKSLQLYVHHVEKGSIQAPAGLYEITPTWMQLSASKRQSGNSLCLYKDISYQLKNGVWKKGSLRSVSHAINN